MKAKSSLVLAAAIAWVPFSVPAPANAQGLETFFKSISGDYRGRGSVRGPEDSGRQRVSCSVKNTARGSTMSVSGRCATTQGKARVSGRLVGSGSKVTGSFIAPFPGAKVLGSNGVFRGNRMAVITVFGGPGGRRAWVRQEIQKTGNGFRANFLLKESQGQSYKPAGSMNFTRR